MTTKMSRVSFTVPPSFRDDLLYVSKRMGISQSSVVSQMLAPALADMRIMLSEIPFQPTESDAVRYRDSSIELIDRKVAEVHQLFGDRK